MSLAYFRQTKRIWIMVFCLISTLNSGSAGHEEEMYIFIQSVVISMAIDIQHCICGPS